VRNIVSGVSLALIAVLLIISLVIMSNTIKLAAFERRQEVAIMRMVGATSGFIRWPFIFEGFTLGLLGALGAFIAQWALYRVASEAIMNANVGFIATIPFSRLAAPLCAVFALVGFGVGVVGSSSAIKKHIKV